MILLNLRVRLNFEILIVYYFEYFRSKFEELVIIVEKIQYFVSCYFRQTFLQ